MLEFNGFHYFNETRFFIYSLCILFVSLYRKLVYIVNGRSILMDLTKNRLSVLSKVT